MDKTLRTIHLGTTQDTATFDDTFFAVKGLFDLFDIDAVTFDFRGNTVRVTESTSVGDAYEQSLPPAL